MIKHYLSSALRSIRRDAGYTFMNVSGLAVGLASCLLIIVFVTDELSYDTSHEKADRIVRLALETRGGDGEWRGSVPTFYQLAGLMGSAFSGVENTTRIADDRALLIADEKQFASERIMLADPSMFDVFSLIFVNGDAESAFSAPYTAVLTREAAEKYFGSENPVGKVISRNGEHDFEVTAVVEAMPTNSHFQFDLLLNMESVENRYNSEMLESMGAQWVYTYLLMDQPESKASIEERLNTLMAQFIPKDAPVEIRMAAQPLTDIHLRSNFAGEIQPNGDIRFLYVFGIIALFILVIASVNFMNLATARATKRAREVGVRKVIGAHRSQLIWQFLGESLGLSLVAMAVSIGLAALALPVFNELASKAIVAAELLEPGIVLLLLSVTIVVGVLSGSYPAFYLSAFRPAHVLKGGPSYSGGDGGSKLRQGLVLMQFSISISIVLGAFIVYGQLEFMQNTSPGFDRDQILSVRVPSAVTEGQVATLKNEFLRQSNVERVSAASHAPPERLNSWRVRRAGASTDTDELISRYEVDTDYIRTLGLEIIEGRTFSDDFPADPESSVLINEALAAYYGLDEPVGAEFEIGSSRFPSGRATVVGVVKDFHQGSMHEEIQPVLFSVSRFTRQMLVRLKANGIAGSTIGLEAAWEDVVADYPFEATFLDDRFNALYESEERLGNIFRLFSFLAIFVACLGLFGLSAYMAERRTREMGIRKSFGATTGQLTALMTREFVLLVVVAFMLAAPVTWLGMQKWLEDFAYRAEFGLGLFVATGILAVSIAAVTVFFQSFRAARMNPIETLRHD